MFTKHTYGMNHVWYVPYSFWYEFHTFVLTVYNAYMCVELNAHSLITFLITLRDDLPANHACFTPWLLGSQSCERTFRTIRSMSSTYSTMINFGILGLLRRLHRLQIQFSLESETDSGIVFPRVLKHQTKQGENSCNKCCLADITNERILTAVQCAREAAKDSIEKLGMAELLKKNSKWDSVTEAANDNDDSDDEDSDDDDVDDNDQSNENKQGSEDTASSLVQEVCSEEPVHITSDIEQIGARGLVENEVEEILKKKQRLLSFKRLPSTTIPMYASAESNKVVEKRKKFCPFVEVKDDNGGAIYIKKTTAVWLIQESERVSSDRFYRVRRDQPYSSKQSKSTKKINSITVVHKQNPNDRSLKVTPFKEEITMPKTILVEVNDASGVSKANKSLNSTSYKPDTSPTILVEVNDDSGVSKANKLLNCTSYKPETAPNEDDDAVSLKITTPKTICSQIVEDTIEQNTSLNSAIPTKIPINLDNVSDTPSHAWIKLNGITLYDIDKYSLENSNTWINGSHMTAVQLLLKSQFPHIQSLQDTIRQDTGNMQPMPKESLQILLVNCNHWVLASTCGINNSIDIILYDSKYSFIHDHTKLLLSHLVLTKQIILLLA